MYRMIELGERQQLKASLNLHFAQHDHDNAGAQQPSSAVPTRRDHSYELPLPIHECLEPVPIEYTPARFSKKIQSRSK